MCWNRYPTSRVVARTRRRGARDRPGGGSSRRSRSAGGSISPEQDPRPRLDVGADSGPLPTKIQRASAERPDDGRRSPPSLSRCSSDRLEQDLEVAPQPARARGVRHDVADVRQELETGDGVEAVPGVVADRDRAPESQGRRPAAIGVCARATVAGQQADRAASSQTAHVRPPPRAVTSRGRWRQGRIRTLSASPRLMRSRARGTSASPISWVTSGVGSSVPSASSATARRIKPGVW